MPLPQVNHPHPTWRFRFECALWWAFALAVATHTRTDPDLFGNLRFGLDVLRPPATMAADPYAFTADAVFVNHEWLSAAGIAAAWNAAGSPGLILLKVALFVATWWPIGRIFRSDAPQLYAVSPLLVVAALSTWGNNLRAQSFSFALFAGVLLIIRCARLSPRALVSLPLVFLLWANLHGGWLVGALTLAAWGVSEAVLGRNLRFGGSLLAAGLASFLATGMTPYGAHLWQFLWESVGFSRPDITDWQPLQRAGLAALLTWLAATLIVVRSAWNARLPLPYAIALLVLAVSSFRVSRITVFYGLAALALALPYAVSMRRRADDLPGAAALAAIIIVAVVGGAVVGSNARCIHMDAPWLPGRQTTVALLDLPPGRIVPHFDWGHLVLWHRGGELLVSMDGRRETVYGADVIARHGALYSGAPRAETYPDELGADYVWLPTSFPVVDRLRAGGWHAVAADERSTLLSRRPLPSVQAASLPSAAARCFPGP